ncbi:lycopene beta-cyclase CrtY [Altererythrobacter salegens]|uniref:Lycopene beta-cyclase CrtY n=1 Tax=Croceibacterium salegens TaxID=1737568 RepID=A0A6I4SVX4_9SPHN|nr:lycopene beta-cyclase CrtY [Croceibacterium salegens]MXO60131.1 lycopene beta-cyclase CrtY [Croceibacterium salegens]
MPGRTCDIAIVGGGLAGGLIALALRQSNPDISVRLIETGATPGGNHRWSWFESDLDDEARWLMRPFRTTRWDKGYDVAFPGHVRHLDTAYRSLSSEDFAAGLNRELAPGTIMANRSARSLMADGVYLEDGGWVGARAVIDCRGFTPTPHLTGGWQVFLGRHMRTEKPHDVTRPVIMDATVDQKDGYHFVYVLPLGADELFIEDTYYQDEPKLDRSKLSGRIDRYCEHHGWRGELLSSETGILPVVTGGNFSRWQAEQDVDGVARAGVHAGFLHPLTSYSLPFAAATANAVARYGDLPGDQLAAMLAARARRHWSDTKFYRRLGSMLFGAARSHERWRVFSHFYGLDEELVERFYAARSTRADRMRILWGRPPVPIRRAIAALATSRPSLEHAA